MTQSRRVYLLDPKKLSPETIAVAFAKTSRSPRSFDEIAAKLSDDRSADFHEKWVVGYGHSSVAEHAVLHIAVENISRLAIECLESNRLASYTEKSSRYQVWDKDHFYIPDEIKDTTASGNYIDTCQLLFHSYQNAFRKITSHLQKTEHRCENETERAYKNRIRSQCADICRYFLPTSALANVGISINARALEHALRKMLSHPLDEVKIIGELIKKVSLKSVPTLVKYANPNDYLIQIGRETSEAVSNLDIIPSAREDWCVCGDFDVDGEKKILAALLYRFSHASFHEAYSTLTRKPEKEIQRLVRILFEKIGNHDIPVRELEYANISFDLILDQGAYFELKRHRMMAQTPKAFTPDLGYAIPGLIAEAGLLDEYTNAMVQAADTYKQIEQSHPHAAAYVLPNGYNRRVLLQMNLRTALHLIKLRCAPNAHFAIRRPVQRIAEEIRGKFPLFARYFSSCSDETWQSLESDFFYQTA